MPARALLDTNVLIYALVENDPRSAKAEELLAAGGIISVQILNEFTSVDDTLYYYVFPREHWRCLRTNDPLERLLREVRRRTRAVGAFPDGKSALMLAAARLRHVAGTKWGTRRYLDMNRLAEASEAA